MSELGDLLELLCGARSSWQTVHMRTRHWTHHRRTHRAFERYREQLERGTAYVQFVSDVSDALVETTYRVELWLERNGRYREMHQDDHVRTLVSDGRRTWMYAPELGATVQDSAHFHNPAEPLLDPSALLVSVEFGPVGAGEAAGRPAFAVRGVPRGRERFFPDPVPHGADEVELLVDRERGVVLRSEARIDGEPFQITEVEAIEFDELFPPETFVFEPPPGEEVRSPEDAYRVDRVTIEEAARRASFAVLAPRGVTGRWEATVLYQPARERPPIAEGLHVAFHDSGTHNFVLEQSGKPIEHAGAPTSVVERNGVALRITEHDRRVGINLVCEGTHARVASDNLLLDSLLDAAASLAPVSPDPPKIIG